MQVAGGDLVPERKKEATNGWLPFFLFESFVLAS